LCDIKSALVVRQESIYLTPINPAKLVVMLLRKKSPVKMACYNESCLMIIDRNDASNYVWFLNATPSHEASVITEASDLCTYVCLTR